MFKETFENILISLTNACMDVYGPRLRSHCVFGSVAAGTMRPDSDIDLLLVCESLPRDRIAGVKEFAKVDRICETAREEARRAGVYTAFCPLIQTPDELYFADHKVARFRRSRNGSISPISDKLRLGSPVFLDMTDTAMISWTEIGSCRVI